MLNTFDGSTVNATLSFPLHQGSLNYLNRDEPSFFERYAELIGVSITIIVLFSGGLLRIRTYLRQRKKDKIDVYYQRLLDLKYAFYENEIQLPALYKKLEETRNKAFTGLIKEELSADSSFMIFMNLYDEIKLDLARQQEKKSNS